MRRDSSYSSGGKTEDSFGSACVAPPRDDATAHCTWDHGRRSYSSSMSSSLPGGQRAVQLMQCTALSARRQWAMQLVQSTPPPPPQRHAVPPLPPACPWRPRPFLPAPPPPPRPLPSGACGLALLEVSCLAPLYAHYLGNPHPLGSRALPTWRRWLPGPRSPRHLHRWTS